MVVVVLSLRIVVVDVLSLRGVVLSVVKGGAILMFRAIDAKFNWRADSLEQLMLSWQPIFDAVFNNGLIGLADITWTYTGDAVACFLQPQAQLALCSKLGLRRPQRFYKLGLRELISIKAIASPMSPPLLVQACFYTPTRDGIRVGAAHSLSDLNVALLHCKEPQRRNKCGKVAAALREAVSALQADEASIPLRLEFRVDLSGPAAAESTEHDPNLLQLPARRHRLLAKLPWPLLIVIPQPHLQLQPCTSVSYALTELCWTSSLSI